MAIAVTIQVSRSHHDLRADSRDVRRALDTFEEVQRVCTRFDPSSPLMRAKASPATKPFSFAELLARIRATLRGASQTNANELVVKDLRLDLFTKVAWRGERRIDLAPREWVLLELFMRHPTHALWRTRILNKGREFGVDPGNNIVDVYCSYLRRKINVDGTEALSLTVRGACYRLVVP